MSKVPPTRTVGVMVNGQVLAPLFPRDGATAAGQRSVLQAHVGIIPLLDYIEAAKEAYGANRVIYHDHGEQTREAEHQRALADLRRRRELAEFGLSAVKAEHALEAEIEFKPDKFQNGHAGFAKRRAETDAEKAEAKLKESVAIDEEPEIIRPEPKAAKTPDLAEYFARQIDDLQEQIDALSADNMPTEELRAQQTVLNQLLRKELLKGRRS
jgi:hypothetical protein